MSNSLLQLAVIVGSVREGRFGSTVANWFAEEARGHGRFEVDTIDLAETPLPLTMPAELDARTAATQEGLARRLAAADAFVLVTPEYNHSIPAGLKNMLDWFRPEWVAKPFGLVSYGGQGGGIRAAEHLRQIIAELHAVSVRDALSFHNAWSLFDNPSAIADGGESAAAAKTMLGQLDWWGTVLRQGRVTRPYEA